MSVFTKYRRNMMIDWGIDTKSFPFVKCSDMPLNEAIPIYGFFCTPDSGYGEGAVVILEKELLSLPQRYVEDIRKYMDDAEVVEAVKDHRCSIIITTFTSQKYKKTGYDVEFIES